MKRTRKRRARRKRTRGGFDARSSFFPAPLSDLMDSIQGTLGQSAATMNGSYPITDPNWRIQPLR